MILSVPHTGTRTIAKITGYPYLHTYDYTTPQDIRNRNGDGVICVPLRNPADVWATWAQRYEARPFVLDPDHPKSMETAWRALSAIDRIFDIVYVPVDRPDRDKQLAILSERMGQVLHADWTPQGARPAERKQATVPERDLDFIYELPFVRRFYNREFT